MIRIKTGKKLSVAAVWAIIAAVLLAAGIFTKWLMGFTDANVFEAAAVAAAPVLIIVVSIYLNKESFDKVRGVSGKTKYVSDLIITDSGLILRYCVKRKVVGETVIPLSEISSVNAVLNGNPVYIGGRKAFLGGTSVEILRKDGDKITFRTYSNTDNMYSFLFALIKNRGYLPGFSYKVVTNEKTVSDYVQYFVVNGKKFPFYKNPLNVAVAAIIAIILFIVMLVSFSFLMS